MGIRRPRKLRPRHGNSRFHITIPDLVGKRVVIVDQPHQPFLQHMRINLCRRYVGMAEQLLDGARSAPFCRRWLAKAWRSTCGEILAARCPHAQPNLSARARKPGAADSRFRRLPGTASRCRHAWGRGCARRARRASPSAPFRIAAPCAPCRPCRGPRRSGRRAAPRLPAAKPVRRHEGRSRKATRPAHADAVWHARRQGRGRRVRLLRRRGRAAGRSRPRS